MAPDPNDGSKDLCFCVCVCWGVARGWWLTVKRQTHLHQPDFGLAAYLSAVITHFEDGCLPGNLLAVGLLCTTLILRVRAAPQTCRWYVEANC